MRKKILAITLLCALVCGFLIKPALAGPTVYPKGVTIYYPNKCFNGYTLCSSKNPVNLIDMNGRVIHKWQGGKLPVHSILPNGHFIGWGDQKPHHKIVELDWDGNVVWSYESKDRLHHDFRRIANGNTLMICHETVPAKYKANIIDKERRNRYIGSDYIIEVTPEGKTVWEWHEYEHLDINRYCPCCHPADWAHTNTVQELPDTLLGKQDHRFKAGNILINPRNHNTIHVIDKNTGQVVWSWGTEILRHPHSVTMLDNGNILLFDNGLHGVGAAAGMSRVLEIDPSTEKVVWEYSQGAFFYSHIASGAQRLPNGNTLVCSSTTGRLFEVTPEKEIVWEFIDPEGATSYRAFRVPYDYCSQLATLPKPKEEAVIPAIPCVIKAVAGDVNGDHVVNYRDLVQLLAIYGSKTGSRRYKVESDLDKDGVIDYHDILVLAANYGRKARG